MKHRVQLLASTAAVIFAVAGSTNAYAQSRTTVVDGAGATGKIVTTDTALATTNTNIVGPVVAVGSTSNQTVYTGFRTTGGSGSGGGAGLGGVFFIDTGASLTLTNVSFANNTVTGGQGGGVRVDSAAPTAFSVAGTTADASAYVQYNTGVVATDIGNNAVQITGLTLSQQNALIGAGSGVGIGKGAAYTSSISNTTINADGTETLSLGTALTLTDGNGVDKVVTAANGAFTFSSNSPPAIQSGMSIVGNGIAAGVVVDQITRDSSNNVTAITAKDANGSTYTLAPNSQFYVVNAQTFDFSRVASSYQGQTMSDTLVSTGALAGFSTGMTISIGGVATGITVKSVTTTTDPDSGNTVTTITLSDKIDLSTATSIKGVFNPLVSNTSSGAVLTLASVSGLAAGQVVSGTGIPAGTTIKSIVNNTVTLSNALSAGAANAITNGNLLLTIDPVVASSAGSVTLTSVSGFRVGDAITGSSIPQNAKITGINAATKTITYTIDPTLATANAGGSMNGLLQSGVVGSNGSNGRTGSTYAATFDNGEGAPGTNAAKGAAGVNAVGGNGGVGGSGSNASSTNKSLIVGLSFDVAALAADFLKDENDAVGFFTLPKLPGDLLGTVVDAGAVIFDTTQLVAWQIAEKDGLVALGGQGGQGGNGGAGSDYFGGGMGGAGGHGGDGAEPNSIGGAGGGGGTGGAGGFGAGGGNGGAGGVAGANGVAGIAGSGGGAGFGGGSGSTAGQSGQGGSGYGGALFVRDGGTLTINGNAVFQNNSALAGSSSNGGAAGSSAGNDLFMMTGSNVNLSPGVGSTITFYDSIADDSSASIPGSIAAGQGAQLNISGGGTVQLFGTNTYTGATNIAGATVEAQDGTGINPYSQIEFSGSGTIGSNLSLSTAGVLLSGGTITRAIGTGPTNVYFAGSGGFAATASNLVLNFGALNGGTGAPLVWGAGGFVPTGSTLIFGSDAADATGTVTLQNAINLAGNTGRIAIYRNAGETTAYDAVLAGAVTNGTLTVGSTGFTGTLLMPAQNSLNGLTLNAGTLSTIDGTQIGRLMNASTGGFVTINGGTLQLGAAEKLTRVQIGVGGSLLAAGAISAGAITNNGITAFGSTLNAASIINSGTLALAGGTTVAGAVANAPGGVLQQFAATTAATVVNNGTWVQAADLTTIGTVTNNGEIDVIGLVSNNQEAAATRTIHTAGFVGSSTGTVNIGGMQGTTANGLVIDQSGASTYAGTLTGAGSLTKMGAGTLTLTGASTFTGGLAINAGTLDTTGGGTLGDTLAVSVGQGATYRVGTADTVGSIRNAGTLVANAALGTRTLSNAGMATINAGLSTTGDVGNAANAQLMLAGGANVLIGGGLSNAGTVHASGPLSVSGLVDNQAGGSVTLDAPSTFGSLKNAGAITANTALIVAGGYIQNAGTLTENANLTTGSFSGSGGTVTLAGGTTFAITQTADGTYMGSVSGNAAVTKAGNATLTLAGAAGSFAPATLTVSAGGVTAQTAGVLSPTLAATVRPAGTLALTGDQAIASLANGGTVRLGANLTTSGTVTNDGLLAVVGTSANRAVHTAGFGGGTNGVVDLGGNALTIDQSGASSFAGKVTGAGTLTKTGAGTLTLTGASDFTGGLTVAGGTIDTTGGGTFADSLGIGIAQGAELVVGTVDVVGNVANAGTLIANADYDVASLANGGSAALNGAFVSAGDVGNTGSIAFNGVTAQIGGAVTNSGTAHSSAALLVIGNVTNTGGIVLDNTAQIGGNVGNDGTLQSNAALVVTGNVTNTGGIGMAGATAQIGGSVTNSGTVRSDAALLVAGDIANTGGFVLAGTTARVGGNVTNGGTFQSGSALTVQGNVANTAMMGLDGPSTQIGGSFANSGTAEASGRIFVGGASTNSGQLTLAAGSATHMVGALANSGTVTGSGTMLVDAAVTNTQTGTIMLLAGGDTQFASLANAGSLTADAPLTVVGGVGNSGTMTLDVGSAPAFGSLVNTGSIVTGDILTIAGTYRQDAGSLVANADVLSGALSGTGGAIVLNGTSRYTVDQSADGSYAGSITGTGSVVKTGAATLTLTGGRNSMAPSSLAVLAGGVQVQQSRALGQTLVVGVAASATLALNADQSIASLASDGTVLLASDLTSGSVVSSGVLTVMGDGATTRSIHTAVFSGGSAGEVKLGGADGTVASTLVIDQSGNSSYAGTFTGAGKLVKTGDGSLQLTGASSFTGGLTVSGGTLDTTGGGTFADTLDVTIGQPATLVVGTADVVGNVTNAGTLVANADYGVVSLTNTGTATLNGGFVANGTVSNAGTAAFGTATRIGGTFTNTGNASANGGVAIGGDLGNTGTLALNGDARVGGSVTNGGTMTLADNGQVGGSVTNRGGMTIAGAFSIGGNVGNTGTLALNGGAQIGGDVVNGGGMTVAGPFTVSGNLTSTGQLALVPASATHVAGNVVNGGTMTSSGTLLVDGQFANAQGATAMLAGSGTKLGSLVNAGTMTATAPLAVTGTVANSGALTLATGGAVQVGSLVNSGTLTSADPLIVTGALQQNAGKLTVNAGLSTGSLSGTGGTIVLANASQYVVNQSTDGTYAGSIAGNGSVVKLGTGTLTLVGGNDSFAPASLAIYQGGVTVQKAGALDNALSVGIATAGTLTLQADQTIHDLNGTGTLAIGANNLTLATGGAFTGSVTGTGAVKFASGSFALDGLGTVTASNFAVQSGSKLDIGASSAISTQTLTLSNAALNLQGTATATSTLVDGSLLHLGNGIDIGQPGAVLGTLNSGTTTVTDGGALTGNGTVTGNVVIGGTSAGTLAPGNSPGVITVTNLTYANQSVAAMQIDGPNGPGVAGGNDLVIVNGTLTLQPGSTLAIQKSQAGSSYELALGQGIQLFRFAPGHVTGAFGAITKTGFAQNLLFNVSNGTVYGLGSYTPAAFAATVAINPVGAAAIAATQITTPGGVAQYRGGNLIGAAVSALASGQSVGDLLKRYSPDGYAGILDEGRASLLENLPVVGGYDHLVPGRIVATGMVHHDQLDGRQADGYSVNRFNNTAFQVGFTGDLSFAQANVSYTRSTGGYHGDDIAASVDGDQFGIGVSAPLTADQALRVMARGVYGDYDAHGTRGVIGGTARFGDVRSYIVTYGGGLEYLRRTGPVWFNASAEALGVHQTLRGFAEAGSANGLDLWNVHRTTHDVTVAKLDGKVGYAISPSVTAYVKGGYIHEFGNGQTAIVADGQLDAVTIAVNNPGLAQDRADAGLGLQVNLSNQLQLNADATGGTQRSYRVGGGVTLRF